MPEDISQYLAIADIIKKMLSGKISIAEKKQLNAWLAENEANQSLLQRLHKTASEKNLPGCWSDSNNSAAWKIFRDKYLSESKK